MALPSPHPQHRGSVRVAWFPLLTVLAALAIPALAVAASMRTVEVTPERAKAGEALFAACAGCHGSRGEGRTGTGPALKSDTFLAAASDQFLIDTITKGRAGTTMIAWGNVYTPEQIQSLVAFLRSLNPVPAAELDESPLRGDAGRGRQIFQKICAACHGRHGGGYQETANGTGIGRKAFLDAASNGYLRYIIEHGKSQTGMRPFAKDSKVAVANLDAQQIEDVIAYLRSAAW